MSRRRWRREEVQAILEDENPFKQFGYDKIEVPHRKVGETWTDARGTKWEQKNGYRVVVNEKANQIRDLTRQNCSVCNMDIRWGDRLDKQFFKKSGMCYECTIEHDTKLRLTGQWENYEKKKVLSSQLSYLKDVRNHIEESIKFLSTTDGKLKFVNELGEVETWTNTQVDTLLSGAKSDHEKLTSDIEETEKLIESLETN